MNQAGSIAAQARALLAGESHGVLSTHSVEMPGYPFGSVVPYCLDRAGRPLILISRLAQHTRNIAADPKVSLLVAEQGGSDVQAVGRVSCLAQAEPLAEDDDAAGRYCCYFPVGRDYLQMGDFAFYQLVPMRAHYVGGFGRIHWVDTADLILPNPFTAQEEQGVLEHMNADHVDALRHYCDRAGIAIAQGEAPVMVGVDGEGLHLRLGARVARIRFDAAVSRLGEVRQALVEMARR